MPVVAGEETIGNAKDVGFESEVQVRLDCQVMWVAQKSDIRSFKIKDFRDTDSLIGRWKDFLALLMFFLYLFLFCLICFWINTGININMHYKEDRTAAPHGAHTPFCVCVMCVYYPSALSYAIILFQFHV